VATAHRVALAERELLSGSDADLLLHDVDTRDELGDWVLDLYARVHLDEEEFVVLVEKFERPRAAIADLAAGFGAPLADARQCAQRDAGGRGFFDDLLMAALHRAIALEQVDGVLVLVGKHLDFDVPRRLEVFFHVHLGIAERRSGFRSGQADRRQQCRLGVHDAHAAAAAAAGP
jgi:hypothetical protein